jgi:CheY-like chemotaxis protein
MRTQILTAQVGAEEGPEISTSLPCAPGQPSKSVPCKTILIVEDQTIAREGLAAVLRREGFEVALLENGLQAIEYLRERRSPAMILLDMFLPVLDGWQFLEMVSTMRPNPTPWIILMTGNFSIGREWAIAHGCKGFLRKPIELAALYEEIRAALQE